jgi:hypothetical protein
VRCAICDKLSKYIRIHKQHKEPICANCRKHLVESRMAYTPRLNTIGDATPISHLIAELEERIPALFIGPVCPRQSCECTYESGCLALKGVDRPNPDVTSKHVGVGDNEQAITKDPVLEVLS